MIIRFYHENPKYRISKKRILYKWINEIVILNKKEIKSLNIIFTSSSKLKKINSQFLKHNYFTDVITFNYSEGNALEGEIYVDYLTVLGNGKFYNEHLKKELCRVIIHGVLHLICYVDGTKSQFLLMKKKENEALELLVNKYGFTF